MIGRSILFIAFVLVSLIPFAQQDLPVSDVFHIKLSSNIARDYIAVEKTITVPKGKLWKISSAKVHMTTKNGQMVGDKTYLYLDDQIIAYKDSRFNQGLTDPIWLKPGTYKILIRSDEKNQREGGFKFFGYINGVEVDFVK